LKTLTKVAIGCGVAMLLAGIVGIVVVVGTAYWAKGKIAEVKDKVEKVTGDEKRIEGLKKAAANAAPFTRPLDGVIREERLQKFIEIRKRVYGVYEQHKAEIEALNKKEKGNLGDLMTAFSWLGEIRTTQAQAQADVGMGDDEYRFMVEQVYKTFWASEVAKQNGGKSVSQATGEAMEGVAQAMKRAQEQAKDATPEQKQRLRDAAGQIQDQAAKAEENAKALDVPKANIELFRKYEADIRKYSMNGLELLGL
jgi:hypothetical protein